MYIEIYKGLIINSIMNNYNCLNLNQYTQFVIITLFIYQDKGNSSIKLYHYIVIVPKIY